MIDVSDELKAAIEGDHEFCHLIELQLNGLTVRLTEAMYDIESDGDTYLGNGVLLDVDGVKESETIDVNSVQISFTAVEQSIPALMLQNNQIDRQVRIYRAYLNRDTSVIGRILLSWGSVTEYSIDSDTDGDTIIAITAAGPFSNWEKTSGRNTTNGSMHKFYPDDDSFEFASQIKPELEWGA